MQKSIIETTRFNLQIFREVYEQEIDKEFVKNLANNLIQHKVDVLFLRVLATQQYNLHFIQDLPYKIIYADTLVYYQHILSKDVQTTLRNPDIIIKNATIKDRNIVPQLVSQIFANYTNHYASNPILPKLDILEGYKEWALGYIEAEELHKFAFIAMLDHKEVGFLTCNIIDSTCEIILNGVLPAYQNRGVYTDLIRFVKNFCINRGVTTIKISTQVQNYAVQKVWVRENFYLFNAYITLHINALLN